MIRTIQALRFKHQAICFLALIHGCFYVFMLIGGLQKTSLTDYPGKVAAIVYTQGCNFRCGFCYNPELVESKVQDLKLKILEEDFFKFLESRQGKLDAVVITGGEPTIHLDLPEFARKIKEMGFLVGLYTNGTNPEMLGRLINENLIDYVSMDIKTQLSIINYQLSTGVSFSEVDLGRVKKSLELLMSSDIDYKIATTVVPTLVTLDDVRVLAEQIRGVKNYSIQPLVKTEKMLDNRYKEVEPYKIEELEQLRDEIAGCFGECSIRN